MKVLCIGAGGLGCDILKNLAMSGFKHIEVIDMDEIDISNLNRQFLFREKDVGKSKSMVAAKFVNERVPGVNVVAHNCRIQDKKLDYYQQFNVVIAGLDSVEARKWLNSTLIQLAEEYDTIIPMIDGGTEGFKGQARVIVPTQTACFECTLGLFTEEQKEFPMCTLAHTPRLPEHCIQYIVAKTWAETKGKPDIADDENIDGDNSDHLKWIFDRASERAQQFGIRGVTYRLTQGVVKGIIPAIASTNAIIASACTNEALKIATAMADTMKNYMTYHGGEGIHTHTYEPEKLPTCAECGAKEEVPRYTVHPQMTLSGFRDLLRKKMGLREPALVLNDEENFKRLYVTKPVHMEAHYRPNLSKPLADLFQSGSFIGILDAQVLAREREVEVIFDENQEYEMDTSED
mmetsp:Transcript_2605/g.9934  ORF Transcript_2605/g.9934 Transcript_2605/m.9934 type:complete len:404 (+) Transcript_2605:3011-4222(+)